MSRIDLRTPLTSTGRTNEEDSLHCTDFNAFSSPLVTTWKSLTLVSAHSAVSLWRHTNKTVVVLPLHWVVMSDPPLDFLGMQFVHFAVSVEPWVSEHPWMHSRQIAQEEEEQGKLDSSFPLVEWKFPSCACLPFWERPCPYRGEPCVWMGSWVKTAYDSLLLLSLNVYGGMGKWLLCEMILWNNENVPAWARLNRDGWCMSMFAFPRTAALLGSSWALLITTYCIFR